jgi:hypothetical protein
MSVISVDAISYSISADAVATVQSCDDRLSIFLPRNWVPFCGRLFGVSVFDRLDLRGSVDTVLIPHSIRRISGPVFSSGSVLKSVVFELWSELEWIGPSAFEKCPLRCIFIPQSVNFIGLRVFMGCKSIGCICFDYHSSLWQLKSANFSDLSNLRAITIP